MQARNIHVPSIVIGVLAATVVLMSMGQSSPVLGPPRIEYGPHPRDMVQIKEGTPYTVPVGRIFVLTGLGASDLNSGSSQSYLKVNGQTECFGGLFLSGHAIASGSVAAVPNGFAVPAGSVIEVADPYVANNYARAWGYLSQP